MATDALAQNGPDRHAATLRRWHSLSGLVPVGGFLVVHLWTQAHALEGPTGYARIADRIESLPLLVVLEVVGLYVPLAFHALYGVVLAARATGEPLDARGLRPWMERLQRFTGIVAFAFIAFHLWQYSLQRWLHRLAWQHLYARLDLDLNRPAVFAIDVTGITASVVHLAYGVWHAGQTFGVTTTARTQRLAAWICLALGALLWFVGMDTVLHFALRCGGIVPLPWRSMRPICAA